MFEYKCMHFFRKLSAFLNIIACALMLGNKLSAPFFLLFFNPYNAEIFSYKPVRPLL